MKCRNCQAELKLSLVDLGSSPPSNAYLRKDQLNQAEKWIPLHVRVCESCWLVQTEDFVQEAELFSPDYAYFSSVSSSWLAHAEAYVEQMVQRFSLTPEGLVMEAASNDGYLLQFVQARGIPCLGIEPTASTAQACLKKGIPVVQDFLGVRLADSLVADGKQADLLAANNVLAHVPDILDFVTGVARLLKPTGVATFEFPHLLNLLRFNQFDTIYHEHFSYLSIIALESVFERCGLAIFDVETLPTHGGSLRVFVQHIDSGTQPVCPGYHTVREEEISAGLNTRQPYLEFSRNAEAVKNRFLQFLLEAKASHQSVAGYGAAAKGNTILNYAGVKPDLLPYVVDQNPAKVGKYLPGSRIPILDVSVLQERKPDVVIIFPWNLIDEIVEQYACIGEWGGRFATFIPEFKLITP